MTTVQNEDYDWARDPDFRLLETCVACEEKKSMCDGGNPCRRCRFNKLDCIYESSALLGKFEELQACVTALDAQLNDLLEETKLLSEMKDAKMTIVKKEPGDNPLQTPPASPVPDPHSRPKSKKVKSATEPSGPVLSITQFTASRNPQSQAGMRLETTYTNFVNFSQLLELVKLVASKQSTTQLLDDNYQVDMSCEIHREDSVFAMWTQPHHTNVKFKSMLDKISWHEQAAINYILEWAYINDPQPYIDPIGFPEVRRNSPDPPPEHSMLVYALAARYAHFAFLQSLDGKARNLGPLYAEYFFGKARDYETECFDSSEPDAVVAYAVMADYAFISLRNIKLTAHYHFKAVRFALQLNFHQPQVNDPKMFTPEQQRRNSLIFEYLVICDATAPWRGTTKALFSGVTQFKSKDLLRKMEEDETQTISENFYIYLRDIVEQYKSLSQTVIETSMITDAEALFLKHEANMYSLYKNLPDYLRAESGYPYKCKTSFAIALRMSLHFHLLLLCSYRYIVMILRQIHTPDFLANAEKAVVYSTETCMRILDSYSKNDIPGVPYICGVAFAMICDTLLTQLRSENPDVRYSAELNLIRALETGRDWAEKRIGWEDAVEFTRRLKKQLDVREVTIPDVRINFEDCYMFNEN